MIIKLNLHLKNTEFMKKKFTDKQISILDVAEELIAQNGFEGTSVREICSKAGINVAMISYYFGSKEKMMGYLYQYRVQKTKDSFSEFAQTIRDGKPEMQLKEIIKFIVSHLFKFSYFHGFVTQELRHTDYLKEDLKAFYETVVGKFDEVVKKGVASGVFTHAPKSEDLLTTILGSSLFVIRNKNFYGSFLGSKENYLQEAEKKVKNSLLQMIFLYVGYNKEL